MITNETDNRFYADINDVREDEDWVQVTISGEGAGKLTEAQIARSLALLLGEPEGWQLVPKELTAEMREALMMIRQELGSTLMDNAEEIYSAFLSWAPKPSASPAPLPVAVKALEWKKVALDSNHWNWLSIRTAETPFGRYSIEKHTKGFLRIMFGGRSVGHFEPDHLPDAQAAAQADYEARIRSALSYPVGGMEETFTRAQMLAEVERRVERALLAKRLVGEARAEFEAENATPTSDIAALREESERLRNALTFYACDPERCDCVTGKEDRENVSCGFNARSVLQHVAKGERG